MECNLSPLERILRVLVAMILGILAFYGKVDGILTFFFSCAVLYFIVTSALNVCPFYQFLGLDNTPSKDEGEQKSNF